MIPPKRAAMWLGIWLAAGLVLGGAALIVANATGQAWIMPTAIAVVAVSVAGPILVAGWLIARGIRRGAGALGLLFAGGMLAAGAGQAASLPWWVAAGGWAAMAVAVIVLYLVVSIPAWRAEAIRREARERKAVERAERRAHAVKRGTSLPR
ncbi:hypothetical protein [Microbacterium gilvum]|uniref:hypothetical protein n=1 Tax=Microbacterium gilvum TaxID=1336204 RepID=UPI0031EE4408